MSAKVAGLCVWCSANATLTSNYLGSAQLTFDPIQTGTTAEVTLTFGLGSVGASCRAEDGVESVVHWEDHTEGVFSIVRTPWNSQLPRANNPVPLDQPFSIVVRFDSSDVNIFENIGIVLRTNLGHGGGISLHAETGPKYPEGQTDPPPEDDPPPGDDPPGDGQTGYTKTLAYGAIALILLAALLLTLFGLGT